MLLLVPGAKSTFVASTSGERPLVRFLRRHSLKPTSLSRGPGSVYLAELSGPRPNVCSGLERSTWRRLFFASGHRDGLHPAKPPDPEARRRQVDARRLEMRARLSEVP